MGRKAGWYTGARTTYSLPGCEQRLLASGSYPLLLPSPNKPPCPNLRVSLQPPGSSCEPRREGPGKGHLAYQGSASWLPAQSPSTVIVMSRTFQDSQILTYQHGIPTSLRKTAQQWDFPNAWAPLQDLVIRGRRQRWGISQGLKPEVGLPSAG